MPPFENAVPADKPADAEGPVMRLRDLIYGLRSANAGAHLLVAQLDPAIADEIHAIAAHRQTEVDDFVALALMELALDHADAAWRAAVERRPGLRTKAEVAELGQVLVNAMQRHLLSEVKIASGDAAQAISFRQYRVGHPYVPE